VVPASVADAKLSWRMRSNRVASALKAGGDGDKKEFVAEEITP